jgi:hypothetical protein
MPHRRAFAFYLLATVASCSPRPADRAADSGSGDSAATRSTALSPGADSADVLAAERRIWEGLTGDHAGVDSLFVGAVDMDPNGITLDWKPGTGAQQLASCVMKSYAMDSAHVKALSPDQRLLTYKASYDWTCGGQRIPSPAYEMALWQRKGAGWALVAHAASVAFTAR